MVKSVLKVFAAAAIILAFWTIVLDLFEIASSWNLHWLRIVLVLLMILYTALGLHSEWSKWQRARIARSGNPAP